MDTQIFEKRFNQYIEDNALVEAGQKILLTVSGGVDSMVMLNLFVRCGYNVGVAHCNFQLRGEESEEDETMVLAEAEKLGIPAYNRRFATQEEMIKTGESVQMTARRLRYAWFNELCNEHGYDRIALAHHADDSIETFFINLLRGTGLKGLTGINVTNGKIIRPLSFASRKEILDYALANKIGYREDSSNRSTKYLRNKIRLGIIPRLREINPAFTKLMDVNIKRLTDAQRLIDHTIDLIRCQAVDNMDGVDIIDPQKIDPRYPTNFVIYELMNSIYGFKGDVVDALCKALENNATGKRFYSRDYTAYIDREKIMIIKTDDSDPCETQLENENGKIYCGNSVIYVEKLDIDVLEHLVVPEHIALLDADKLQFPLKIRRWQDGDSFVPFGMNESKKVSDFLINAKVPMAEKKRQFVLISGDDIVWLIGRRTDNRYRIGKETENVLRLTKEILN
ncbi:MAG: tRNA lysidine(34) synthetase TilS [Tidjanibacter sp.]|nr:tRNA lysidine(34) synthetase TilS [Tidjanibacter sp.]